MKKKNVKPIICYPKRKLNYLNWNKLMPRRINHNRRILSEQIVSKSDLVPGEIIRFGYTSPNKYDPKPLVLFLYHDKVTKLIHGINLNYLYEADIQRIFKQISNVVDVELKQGKGDNGFTKVKLTSGKSKTGVGAEKLYERVIKPKIFSIPRTKNCYRTYKTTKITQLRLINYQMDVIEQELRDSTGLKKSQLKTNELFKNVQEQEIEVKTDNVKIDSQPEVRKK